MAPNQSILFDSVKDIVENHKKNYKRNNPIVHFSTSKWASFQKNNTINSQNKEIYGTTISH